MTDEHYSCRVSEQNIQISLDKIVRKIVAKLHKYKILFKDILTFLGLDYRDTLLIIFTLL